MTHHDLDGGTATGELVGHADDAAVPAFAAHGWAGGGSWDSPLAYQHFSTTGR